MAQLASFEVDFGVLLPTRGYLAELEENGYEKNAASSSPPCDPKLTVG